MSHALLTTAYRVHFKVDKFTTGQSYDNLSLVDSTLDNVLLARCFPFIDSLV